MHTWIKLICRRATPDRALQNTYYHHLRKCSSCEMLAMVRASSSPPVHPLRCVSDQIHSIQLSPHPDRSRKFVPTKAARIYEYSWTPARRTRSRFVPSCRVSNARRRRAGPSIQRTKPSAYNPFSWKATSLAIFVALPPKTSVPIRALFLSLRMPLPRSRMFRRPPPATRAPATRLCTVPVGSCMSPRRLRRRWPPRIHHIAIELELESAVHP
mmetsp:Transcript_8512/g.20811  ORF Transcript_8512/g.20811 Transcript_8512/m.20811 type:complete len:213 (+) Transcript_8512:1058-1696(+)